MSVKMKRRRGTNLCLPLRSEQRSWTGKGRIIAFVFFVYCVTWLQVAAAHVSQRAGCNLHVNIGAGSHCHCCSITQCVVEDEEGCHKMLPANMADHLCQPCYVTRYISLHHFHVVCGGSCIVNDAGQKQKRQLLQKLLTLVQTWRPTWKKPNGLCCPAASRWRLLGAALLIWPSSVGASRKQCGCWMASRSVLLTSDMPVCMISTVLHAGTFLQQSCPGRPA